MKTQKTYMDNSCFLEMIDEFTINTIKLQFNNKLYNDYGDMYEDVEDAYITLYDANETIANNLGLHSLNDKNI
jgi:hypothetical protein